MTVAQRALSKDDVIVHGVPIHIIVGVVENYPTTSRENH